MNRFLLLARPLAVVGLLAAAGVAISAADHADSPATSQANLDINDLYVFNQGSNVVFVMTVNPLLSPGESTNDARLNPNGLYEFKLDRERDGRADAAIRISVRGTGDNQTIRVRGPGPVRGSNGAVSAPPLDVPFNDIGRGGGLKAWAGPSDDPFFINLFGDQSLTSVLNAAFGGALGQTVGDPAEQSLSFEDPAVDDLRGLNVLSIVVEAPKSQIADALGIPADGTFFAWAETSELR